MSEPSSSGLISDLLGAADMLSANMVLRQIDAFLSGRRAGRAAFCRELSRALFERARPFASWPLLDRKGYVIYHPAVAVQIYLWIHGLGTAGAVSDTVLRVREVVEHIDASFTEPLGNRLSERRAERVLQILQDKFPYLETVSRLEPLRIFLFGNSHKQFNAECSAGSVSGRLFVFVYHVKDRELSPEYVFLHELGHALQVSLTGSVDVVPEEFLRFDQSVGGQLEQGDPDAPEVFADLFAIAAMRGTELSPHDPFPFPDGFKGSVENLMRGLFPAR